MRVPVHSNAVGLKALYLDLESCTSVLPHGWGCRTDNRIVSFSNKPPIIQGARPFPTNYWRKAWAVFGGSYELKDAVWRSRGDSRIYGGFKTITGGSNFDYPQTYTPPWMEEKAVASCYQQLREFRTLILEELAQAKKTAKLLFSILKAIVSIVKAIRKADFSRAFAEARAAYTHVMRPGHGLPADTYQRVKNAGRQAYLAPKKGANAYLAWRYGVLPLASTFEALAAGAVARKLKSKTVKSSQKEVANPIEFTSTGSQVLSGGAGYTVKCQMTADVEMSAFTALRNSLGLTRWDAIATLWALVPYSFVVDWFIPVQQWLQNQEFTSGIKYLYGHVTRRHWCDARFRVTWGVPYTSADSAGTWPEYQIKAIHMVRDASIGIPPVVGLVIKTVLSSTNQLDALALVLQRSM